MEDPSGHATHALPTTCSSTAHNVAVHCVSSPLASLSATLVVPAAHAVHALLTTCSFSAHNTGLHRAVGASNVLPAAQVQTLSTLAGPATPVAPAGHSEQVPANEN